MTLLGFSLALLSAILHAGWNVVARKVVGNVGVLWLALVLGALAAVPLLPWMGSPGDLSAENLGYIAGTGILLALYVGLLSGAYGIQELSYVYPISRGVGLVGTVVAGWAVFHEAMTRVGLLGLLVITAGTVSIGFERKDFEWRKGLLLAVLPGVALVATYLIGKFLAHTISPLGYCVGMYAVAAMALAPFVFGKHRAAVVDAWHRYKGASLFVGVASLASYAVLLLGFRTDKAAYLVAVRELSVPLAVVGGAVFLREKIDLRRALGVLAIVGGAVAMKLL